MKTINREGRRKREMRNLIRRGHTWYWKKMMQGQAKWVSLATEDLELAKAKRSALERAQTQAELLALKGPRGDAVGTIAEVFAQYDLVTGVMQPTKRANKTSLLGVVRLGLNRPGLEATDIRLDVLTSGLVRNYQDALRLQYESAAGSDRKEIRMAGDRADRTSSSTIRQAKSIFCRRRQLVERYRESGIAVPECVLEFRAAGAVGKASTKVYFPPSDAIVAETFRRIEELRATDIEAYYMFWGALATGCRRGELADMRVSDLTDIDGRLWVVAGLGKDGRAIRIPCIDWQIRAGVATTPAMVLKEQLDKRKAAKAEFLFEGHRTERHEGLPGRLNAWLTGLGWRDEKKLHGLRAYIGCKIYVQNPLLAKLYLRHKSIVTTESFYSHFLELEKAFGLGVRSPIPAPLAVVSPDVQTTLAVA